MISATLTPRTLRDLGHALIARAEAAEAAKRRPRHELTPEGVERLAQMLVVGDRPTIGFWSRYRAEGR